VAGSPGTSFVRHLPFRIALGVGVPLGAAGLTAFLFFTDPLRTRVLVCPTYWLTGIYCPGCGTTRMLHALLHLRVLEAFGHNPLFFFLLPLVVYYLLAGYLRLVAARPVLPELRIPQWATVAIGVAVLVFTVARNLPWFPFTWLAP